MKRAVIAFVLALAALALLASLALESRSLPVETHVAQFTITGDLERLDADFKALVDTLQAAWMEQTQPGEGARALLERVAAQPQQLPASLFTMQGSASQEARLRNSQETFLGAVGQATALAEELIADQTAYAAAVAFLREQGATVIQELRDAGLARQSADTFQLVVGTLDFAGVDTFAIPSLPLDGMNAVYRDRIVALRNLFETHSRCLHSRRRERKSGMPRPNVGISRFLSAEVVVRLARIES